MCPRRIAFAVNQLRFIFFSSVMDLLDVSGRTAVSAFPYAELCSSDVTQIWTAPSSDRQRCSLPVRSHASTCAAVAGSRKLSLVRVMTSTSAQQLGHQARAALAWRTTNIVSVSTVTLIVLCTMARSLAFVAAAF